MKGKKAINIPKPAGRVTGTLHHFYFLFSALSVRHFLNFFIAMELTWNAVFVTFMTGFTFRVTTTDFISFDTLVLNF